MCGISFVLSHRRLSEDCKGCKEFILRRGPDAVGSYKTLIGVWNLYFTSSVLHLRGSSTVPQPMVNDRFILQWNGEIYAGIDVNTRNCLDYWIL